MCQKTHIAEGLFPPCGDCPFFFIHHGICPAKALFRDKFTERILLSCKGVRRRQNEIGTDAAMTGQLVSARYPAFVFDDVVFQKREKVLVQHALRAAKPFHKRILGDGRYRIEQGDQA